MRPDEPDAALLWDMLRAARDMKKVENKVKGKVKGSSQPQPQPSPARFGLPGLPESGRMPEEITSRVGARPASPFDPSPHSATQRSGGIAGSVSVHSPYGMNCRAREQE